MLGTIDISHNSFTICLRVVVLRYVLLKMHILKGIFCMTIFKWGRNGIEWICGKHI